jgi:hypothetical protein
VLVSTGAALGSLAMLRSVDASTPNSRLPIPSTRTPVLIGTIERVVPPSTLHLRNGAAQFIVEFASGATFWRDHLATLASFVPGDAVIAEGKQANGVFASTALMSILRRVEGRILRRVDDQLHTTAGIVQLTSDTHSRDGVGLVARPLTALAAGDEILAFGRYERATGMVIALLIGVKTLG